MKAFPIIKRDTLSHIFDSIKELYNQDKVKLLEAANQAFAQDSPFQIGPDNIDPQIIVIKNKVRQVGDGLGQKLFIKLIEQLYENLSLNGAIGVTREEFCSKIHIKLRDSNNLIFQNGKWILKWELSIPNDQVDISLLIRAKNISEDDVIPNYIIEYVDQAIFAFQNKKNLTSLSLISIALEGTLRDILEVKGYTYSNNRYTVDRYAFKQAQVLNTTNGFNVSFTDEMPKSYDDFLTEPGNSSPHRVNIKRVQRGNNWSLEIKNANYLKDFWSSDQIQQQGEINIGGLGTALNVARDVNEANVLEAHILPTDLDGVIKKVRNNLIHLSGSAVSTPISGIGQTLEDFAKNEARVFDTINSICEAIQTLYTKKADGTL